MAKEIFISHQSDSKDLAMQLVNYLEKNGHSCWVAPRDVDVSYAGDIVDAIEKCKIFVLLLTKKSCSSVHVLNEMEQAYRYYGRHQLIIIPLLIEDFNLDDKSCADMLYYIARIQRIQADGNLFIDAQLELLKKINEHLGTSSDNLDGEVATPTFDDVIKANIQTGSLRVDEQRTSNRYYDVNDKYEKRRLKTEGEMLLPYEKEVLGHLLNNDKHLNGLVVSCMYAQGVMKKFNMDQFDKMIGLCYNEKATFEANYDYKSDKCKFYTQDVEEFDFEDNLIKIMKENEISGFDYMDITMGFLDWKAPFKVIKILMRYMNPGCRIFVRDIDDQVAFADPDDRGLFKKFFTFYSLNSLAGCRKSGRRVFSYFKKIGAKEIKIEKKGIDTADMNFIQKSNMFHSMFGFIPNDFRILYNQEKKKEYKEIIDWCDQYYDDLEEAFMNEDFLYNSSYILYAIKM